MDKRISNFRFTKNNTGYLLAQALKIWNELLYHEFCLAGFPEVRPSYGAILIPLFEEEGLGLKELGDRAGLSKQTMTTMVRNLETRNLVKRKHSPHDGRFHLLFLTPKGQRLKAAAIKIIPALEKKISKALPDDFNGDIKVFLKKFRDLTKF